MPAPLIRIGLANPASRMAAEMEARQVPVMVSANSLFDHAARRFRQIPVNLQDLDVALDSAGFVAMQRYGRFPWSVAQYVELAVLGGFTWWSQMDCCCEPEIAQDRAAVDFRVEASAQLLAMCRDEYFRLLRTHPEFEPFATPPMPIAQGWSPEDYERSVEHIDDVLGGEWPEMIGVGSVCRRNLNGPDGLWRVLHALDQALPPAVQLHLFGVKGTAIAGLTEHPRVVSTDSMAFELHARIDARKAGVRKTTDYRVQTMERWLERQQALARTSETAQLALSI